MGNISVQANIIFVCTFTEEKMMNGFDDFDTQQQSEEVYRDESLHNGKYHGPSNEAGLTAREYWEMMAAWEDERNDW